MSYVRGPRRPLWLGGLPHRATYAALPVSDTVLVAVGAVGLGGALGMSVTARSGALPEVAFFAKALETSFAEVVGLGGS